MRRSPIVTVLEVPATYTHADSQLIPFVLINVRKPTCNLVTQEQRQAFVVESKAAVPEGVM